MICPQRPLELRQSIEDMEQEFALRRGGVHLLGQRNVPPRVSVTAARHCPTAAGAVLGGIRWLPLGGVLALSAYATKMGRSLVPAVIVVTDQHTEAGSVQNNQGPRAPRRMATPEYGDNPQNGPMVGNSAPSHGDEDGSGRLPTALNLARRLYRRVRLRDLRSDRALRLFLAGVALLIREALRRPERFDRLCAEAEIKRGKKRLEVRVIRLAANDPGLHAPKWANAAAYIAMPPNGDPPPPTLRAAERYLRKRGGMREVSDLYAAHRLPKSEAVDMTDWADAQLEGIPSDAEHGECPQLATDPAAYRIGLIRLAADGSARIWLLAETGDFGGDTVRRAVKNIKQRTILEDGPRTYIERSMAARAARAVQEDELADSVSAADTTDHAEVDDRGLDSKDRNWLDLSDLLDFVSLRLANVGAASDLRDILREIGEDEHFIGVCLIRKLPGYLPHIFGPTTDSELVRRVTRKIQKESGK
jgi:hypothetical protein